MQCWTQSELVEIFERPHPMEILGKKFKLKICWKQKQVLNRRVLNHSSNPTSAPSASTSSGSGGGGFAEIMRKNREAAAKRGSFATNNSSSNGVASAPSRRPTGTKASSSSSVTVSENTPVEERLLRIEEKLDKIMAHLGIT